MADFILTSVSTIARSLDGSESGLITRLGGIYSDVTAAVTATAGTNWLTNDGYIYTYNSGNAAIDANGGVFELLNGSDGVINAENPSSGTIDLDLDVLAQIVNHGTIHSSNGDAINFRAVGGVADFELYNTGRITANDTNAIDADVGLGEIFIVNTGVISAEFDPIIMASSVTNTGTHSVQNSGTIMSADSEGVQVNLANGATLMFSNSGIISAFEAALESTNDTTIRLFNSGLMESIIDNTSIIVEGGSDLVRNTGTLLGDVLLGSGSDTYNGNGGVVNGTVYGEIGSDTLTGGEQADDFRGGVDSDLLVGRGGDDLLDGESGSDRIFGGSGNDDMLGGEGNDTMNGQSGNDSLDGGLDNDILSGQDGADFLVGAAGNDTLDGGEGDDLLFGGADSDVLRGRDGVDFIDGGLGRDITEGGTGADLFIFNNILDSTPNANRDVILDFEKGIDTINLVNVVPGVFVFRGTSGFTATGGPELRLQETPDGSTIIHMDVDGNGTSDMQIRTAGVTGLTADDFDL